MRRTLALAALLLVPAQVALAQQKQTDFSKILDAYVKRPHTYSWKVKKVEAMPDGIEVVRLQMTSQVWKGITWKHRLNVIVPPAAKGKRARPGHALLAISGSGGERQHIMILTAAALRMGIPIAVLHDVPNQPLFRNVRRKGLKEDALIAYTFKKYAETGDTDWPALLPMTRAAVAAMDTLRAYSAQRAKQSKGWGFGQLQKFVTTGGSKRGWTTWLSGVVDKRVIGIAPIVFDNLNFKQQIKLHYKTWGRPSPSIHDYTDAGLLQMLESKRGNQLLEIVDPYSYRKRLTMPKLVLIGTNDTYWPLESVNVYRGTMPGELHYHYVPNAGHSAGLSIVQALSGFFDHLTGRIKKLPRIDVQITPRKSAFVRTLNLGNVDRIRSVTVWSTRISGKDFTKARWVRVAAERRKKGWNAKLPTTTHEAKGRAAFIGEVELKDSGGESFKVHSPVQVWELGLPRPTQ